MYTFDHALFLTLNFDGGPVMDRIMVLCGGQVSGIVDARSTTKDELGLLMIHVEKFDDEEAAG